MRPLEVIISSGGPFHAYHVVRGAQQAGYLKRFITALFDRHETDIDRTKVRQILLPELTGQVIWRHSASSPSIRRASSSAPWSRSPATATNSGTGTPSQRGRQNAMPAQRSAASEQPN